MRTGYFWRLKYKRTKVHIINKSDKPICGAKTKGGLIECTGHIINVDCKKCLEIWTIK